MDSAIQKEFEAVSKRLLALEEVHTSRRGPEGGRGEKGIDGVSNVPGPAGKDPKIVIGKVESGKEASAAIKEENGVHVLHLTLPRGPVGAASTSITPGPRGEKGEPGSVIEAVAAANIRVVEKFAELQRGLKTAIGEVLIQCGVVDQNGKAILLRGEKGEAGEPGKDSFVEGPRGATGIGIQGIPGRDGQDSKVSGAPGPRGPAGDISAAVHNALETVNARLAQFKTELLAELNGKNATA